MTRNIFLELRNSGFVVDDDNEPVSENTLVATTVNSIANIVIGINSISAEYWGFDGVDQ